MAHRGETNRTSSTSSKQVCKRVPKSVRGKVDWGTLKPIDPYKSWLTEVMEPNETLYVPCAGTAPAALAIEREWGEQAKYICMDSEKEAKKAFDKRRELQLNSIFDY